jgi:ribonuclease HI
VVLNGTRAEATAADVSIYCPVSIDPLDPHFLGATRGTNNTGELQGVCEALLWLRDHDGTNLDAFIYVDSKYAPAVVEARWGFSSNIALTLTTQAVLVQVRAHRNVHFRWVHGHSGDVWNDAADAMATLGQDPDVEVRTACTEGRYCPGTPRTLLAYDPRHGGAEHGLHADGMAATDLDACVAPSDAPHLDTLRRVTCAHGVPQGFSSQVFASQVSRVTWASGADGTTRAQFSVKAVRRALQAACANMAGEMHVHAARVVAACPHTLPLRWRSMWREGWSAPWPTRTTDMWWKMAAGTQYVAHLRRHHDPGTAFCRACVVHQNSAELDTHRHLYYECPCHRGLWSWSRCCLDAVDCRVRRHHASFMLYGVQELRGPVLGEDLDLSDPALRVVQYVRAAIVEAFYTGRAATMTPDAPPVHPCAGAAVARKLLRAYIRTDWYAATRAHKRHTHLVRPPAERARGHRPTSIPHFAKVWHRFAGVRSQGELEWLGPCAGPAASAPRDAVHGSSADTSTGFNNDDVITDGGRLP